MSQIIITHYQSLELIKSDTDISNAIDNIHSHDNLEALNKIGLSSEDQKLTWFGQKLENSLDIATEEISGLMNFEDKILLDSLEDYINNFTPYIHPEFHEPSIILQNSNNRFVTDAEKIEWNSKWDYDENDIKSIKVDNAVNADTVNGFTVGVNVPSDALFTDTVYIHPSTHPASIITESISRRFVTDVEKAAWNSKWDYDENDIKSVKVNNAVNADTVNGFTVGVNVPSNALFTDTVYIHPSTHPASIITESISRRFVTDVEKAAWNSKWDFNEIAIKQIKVNNATNADNADTINNLTVETAVPENALFTDTIYIHPSTHPASIIEQNSTNRFVTDSEKTYWNSKWTYDENTIKNVKVNEAVNADTVNNLTVLTAVPENALFTDTIYEHPLTHPATIIVQDATHRFVTDSEKSYWNNKWTYNEETIKNVKVNEAVNADTVNNLTVETAVPVGALFTDTIYEHPGTHPATMIVQDETHRFVTDSEKNFWSYKWTYDENTIKNVKVFNSFNSDLVDGKDINDYYNKNEVDTLISRFIYYQPTPMLDWLITHNLNRFPSSVVITDSAGSVVEGAIQYIDVNNIKVSFNYQFSGTAFIA